MNNFQSSSSLLTCTCCIQPTAVAPQPESVASEASVPRRVPGPACCAEAPAPAPAPDASACCDAPAGGCCGAAAVACCSKQPLTPVHDATAPSADLTQTYQSLRQPLLAYLRRLVGDVQSAEDVLQEVLVKAIVSLVATGSPPRNPNPPGCIGSSTTRRWITIARGARRGVDDEVAGRRCLAPKPIQPLGRAALCRLPAAAAVDLARDLSQRRSARASSRVAACEIADV